MEQNSPWEVTAAKSVKKHLAFYETRSLNITVPPRTDHWTPSLTALIQSISSHVTYINFILILSSDSGLVLQSGLIPSDFSTKILYVILISPTRAIDPAHPSSLICSPLWYLFLIGKWNKKDSERGDSEHSPNLIFS